MISDAKKVDKYCGYAFRHPNVYRKRIGHPLSAFRYEIIDAEEEAHQI